MKPAVKVTSPLGDEEILPLTNSVLSLGAVAGASYRIVDAENPAITFEAVIRRVGDDLLVDLVGIDGDVLLVDYFFVCEFDYRGCTIELESLGGPVGTNLTPDDQGSAKLADGTVLLWSTPPAAVSTPAPTASTVQTDNAQASDTDSDDSGAFSIPGWAVGSGAALLALTALGAGGGGDDSAVGSDSVDRSGSGTLANRSASITRIQSDEPVPVDENGQELADPNLDLGVGLIAQDGQTNDASPTLVGTLDSTLVSGQEVIVFRDGQEVGRATVDELQWTFTDTEVPAGNREYAVRIADGQGNQSPLSGAYTISVDGSSPGAPVVNAVTGDNQISEIEATADVAVSGTAEAGARISGRWGDSTVTTEAGDDGRFVLRFDPSDLPGQGVQVLEVTATDSFGNTSDPTSQAILMPGNAVQISGVIDDVGSITGPLEDESITDDTFPTLFGTLARPLAPGEVLQVWRNGVEVATGIGDGVIVDGTDWSFTDGRLLDGIYENSVRIIGSDGSAVDISDTTFTFIIDNDALGTPSIQTTDGSNASSPNFAAGIGSNDNTSSVTIASDDVLETDGVDSLSGDQANVNTLQPAASDATIGNTAGQWLDNNFAQNPNGGT